MRPFSCRGLARYLREADDPERLSAEMEAHVASCNACRALWRKHAVVRNLLYWSVQQMEQSDVPEPDEDKIALGVRTRIGDSAARRRNRREGVRNPGIVLGLCAGVTILGISFLGYTHFRPQEIRFTQAPLPQGHGGFTAGDKGRSVRDKGRVPSKLPGLGSMGTIQPISKQKGRKRDSQDLNRSGDEQQEPSRSSRSTLDRWTGLKPRSRNAPSAPPAPQSQARPDRETGKPLRHSPPSGEPKGTPQRTDDLAYLNGVPGDALPPRSRSPETAALKERARRDDFVTPVRSRFAARTAASTGQSYLQEIKRLEKEANVLDLQLFQPVSCTAKDGDLSDLLLELSRQTGVAMSADPAVGDLKVTALLESVPARNVMRQLAALFPLEWHRYPEKRGYRYELVPSLRGILAEQSLEERDRDEMLLTAVEGLKAYRPYVDMDETDYPPLLERVRREIEAARDPALKAAWESQERILSFLRNSDDVRDSLPIVATLTPNQWLALRNGHPLIFDSQDPTNPVPPTVFEQRRAEFNTYLKTHYGGDVEASPESFRIRAVFSLEKTGHDRVSLKVRWTAENVQAGHPHYINETTNMLSEGFPVWRNSTPNQAAPPPGLSYSDPMSVGPPPRIPPDPQAISDVVLEDPNGAITSGDFYEALHQRTGLNVLADSYTRLLPASSLTFENLPLVVLLNRASVSLQSDWTLEDDLLRFQRVNAYAERKLDAPARLLRLWADRRRLRGYSDLDDLEEMSRLPAETLEYQGLQQAVLYVYGLGEWKIAQELQPTLQAYGLLTPEQRRRAQAPEGLSLGSLSPSVANEFLSLAFGRPYNEADRATARFQIRLSEPGAYTWWDREKARHPFMTLVPDVREFTREQAEAQVEKLLRQQGATEGEVAQEKERIRGPKAQVSSRIVVGNAYILREANPRDLEEPSGILELSKGE